MCARAGRSKAGGDPSGFTANTALACHAGRILALNEGDVPYHVSGPRDAVPCHHCGTWGAWRPRGVRGACWVRRGWRLPVCTARVCTSRTCWPARLRRLQCTPGPDPAAHARLQVRVLCTGLLETLGRTTFGGRLGTNFTAHPKLDPATGARRRCPNPVAEAVMPQSCGGGGDAPILGPAGPSLSPSEGLTWLCSIAGHTGLRAY